MFDSRKQRSQTFLLTGRSNKEERRSPGIFNMVKELNPRWKEEGAVFALINAQRQENAWNNTQFLLADTCHFVPASNSELKIVMEEATCEQMNYGLDGRGWLGTRREHGA